MVAWRRECSPGEGDGVVKDEAVGGEELTGLVVDKLTTGRLYDII